MSPSNHPSVHPSINLSLFHTSFDSSNYLIYLSTRSFTYPSIQSSIHPTHICWALLKGPFWPQACRFQGFLVAGVAVVGLASL